MGESPKMTLAMAFETAMIDAINRYVREVLFARGHISREGFDASSSQECLQAKYAIAREWGASWAAFDGYEREPPTTQREVLPDASADRRGMPTPRTPHDG